VRRRFLNINICVGTEGNIERVKNFEGFYRYLSDGSLFRK
jgi:hypothetical protein